MVNNAVLTGRLVKDPELKYYNGEKSICYFTIAVNRNYKNANGEYDADFINCKAYRQTAEYLSNFCRKGDLIGVVGSIEINKKDDNMGVTQYYTNISCQNVNKLQTAPENKANDNFNSWNTQPTNNFYQPQQNANQQAVSDFMNLDGINEDDLPF